MGFLRLGSLFITVSLLELFLLLQVGSKMGIMWTISLILFTGFLGAFLARVQGLQTLQMISETMAKGQMPTQEILAGVCILIASALLLTPGLLTDLFGFALLTPMFRRFILKYIQRWVEKKINKDNVIIYHP